MFPIHSLPKLYFPHFHRVFSEASLKRMFDNLLWYLVIFIALLNLFHSRFFPFDELKRLKRQIIQYPFYDNFHKQLGKYYLQINEEAAYFEYSLAQELYSINPIKDEQVLGISPSPQTEWIQFTSKKKEIEKELLNWEIIQKKLPDYLYAKIKKATLYYQLGDKNQAYNNFQNAYKDSPANEILRLIADKFTN